MPREIQHCVRVCVQSMAIAVVAKGQQSQHVRTCFCGATTAPAGFRSAQVCLSTHGALSLSSASPLPFPPPPRRPLSPSFLLHCRPPSTLSALLPVPPPHSFCSNQSLLFPAGRPSSPPRGRARPVSKVPKVPPLPHFSPATLPLPLPAWTPPPRPQNLSVDGR